MDKILNKLLALAHVQPARVTELDMLCQAWAILTVAQKRIVLNNLASRNVASTERAFDSRELVAELDQVIVDMETQVVAAGYAIKKPVTSSGGFFWVYLDEASEDFYDREDAVVDAFRQLMASPQPA